MYTKLALGKKNLASDFLLLLWQVIPVLSVLEAWISTSFSFNRSHFSCFFPIIATGPDNSLFPFEMMRMKGGIFRIT